MKNHRRFGLLLLFLWICAAPTYGGILTGQQRGKLHPFFQSVLTHHIPGNGRGITSGQGIVPSATTNGVMYYEGIIYTRNPEALREMGIRINSVLPQFVTAQMNETDLEKLSLSDAVTYVRPGAVYHSLLDISVPETGADRVHAGDVNGTSYTGRGAIVMIYDSGIDFRHLDFRNPSDTTKSRILFIWDQTLTPTGGESSPNPYTYGVEYSKSQIEKVLNGSQPGLVREKDIEGHGTHIAGIAAGNGSSYGRLYTGMAPDADIIVVKGGDGVFTETKEIDGLTYAANKAAELHEPIVVNLSLGGHVGAHDGTSPGEIAIDNFVGTPGHMVCIAAGNEGTDLMHVEGSVDESAPATFTINVPNYVPNGGNDNNGILMDIWLRTNQDMSVTVTSPTGISCTCPSDTFITGSNQSDGAVDLTSESGIQTTNSFRNVQVFVHDPAGNHPATGLWSVTLATTGGSVAFNGWLESVLGIRKATLPEGNSDRTVSIPGTAGGAVTVASYVTKWNWTDYGGYPHSFGTPDRTADISNFSSIGPTGDSRQKPDIAAPGQGIVAPLSGSFRTTGIGFEEIVHRKYFLMAGTSMATPHVTGGLALILGVRPSLTSDQVKYFLLNGARTDSYTGVTPNVYWGHGKLDMYATMALVTGTTAMDRPSADGSGTFSLQQNYPNPFNPSTTIEFNLASSTDVSLKIFDVLGREVATLIDGRMTQGEHRVSFNAGTLGSGIYFYRLTAGVYSRWRRMALIK